MHKVQQFILLLPRWRETRRCLGGASDEEQKAEKVKLNLKLRWFQGCVGSLAASPALGRSKMLQQHLHPLLHRGKRPVAVPEDRYDLPWGTCAAPSR